MGKERIWELDALRGVSILGVIVIHLLFDLQVLWGLNLLENRAVSFVMTYGGVIFVVLSGLCATLGSRSLRRGVVVLAAGLLITAVTWTMARLGLAGDSAVIRFGVLHLLGVCMILWPLFRRLPWWGLAALGAALAILGLWFGTFRVETAWLFPLGLRTPEFTSADYFPLFPHLGWFLLGSALGKTLYREKRSLLPRFPSRTAPVRFFRWCGRQSLWLYLLHQPVIFGLVALLSI